MEEEEEEEEEEETGGECDVQLSGCWWMKMEANLKQKLRKWHHWHHWHHWQRVAGAWGAGQRAAGRLEQKKTT